MTGRIQIDLFTTLDLVAQAPGDPDEDRDGGFPFGGWQAPLFDDARRAERSAPPSRARRAAARTQDVRHLRGLLAEPHRRRRRRDRSASSTACPSTSPRAARRRSTGRARSLLGPDLAAELSKPARAAREHPRHRQRRLRADPRWPSVCTTSWCCGSTRSCWARARRSSPTAQCRRTSSCSHRRSSRRTEPCCCGTVPSPAFPRRATSTPSTRVLNSAPVGVAERMPRLRRASVRLWRTHPSPRASAARAGMCQSA